ncbi:MAG: hypothetical protein U0559_07995 [Anaerolineae bacterium]
MRIIRTGSADQRIYSTTFEGVINNLSSLPNPPAITSPAARSKATWRKCPAPPVSGQETQARRAGCTVGNRNIAQVTSLPVIHGLDQ